MERKFFRRMLKTPTYRDATRIGIVGSIIGYFLCVTYPKISITPDPVNLFFTVAGLAIWGVLSVIVALTIVAIHRSGNEIAY